jgi:hypothetical protein
MARDALVDAVRRHFRHPGESRGPEPEAMSPVTLGSGFRRGDEVGTAVP